VLAGPISSVNYSNAAFLTTVISLVTANSLTIISYRDLPASYRRSSVSMKNSAGNISRIIMNVYFRFRSAFLNVSSQLGPQNSLSNEIGVAQITQCLCLGIV